MGSIALVVVTFIGYILAYKLYGKYLGSKIFKLSVDRKTPAHEFEDGVDYVPTKKEILFGHHYTSIAGLGPIVGPAIAVIWGWLPAILWVFFGSIFMGAVHDFGSLVISMRNQGKSIGDIVSILISPRVRWLFLFIILFELWIVIAVFALVIAVLFVIFPESVIPIWIEIPIAIWLGYMIYKVKIYETRKSPFIYSIIAIVLLYVGIVIGAYYPIKMPSLFGLSPIVVWMLILFVYAFIASSLPVWVLLQPRDYMNAHELYIMLFLLVVGVFFSAPEIVAPAVRTNVEGAPSMFPFLFVIIACGAISGFHSLVSSGTTSKQINKETDAVAIGYGGMLMEAVLSTLVIVAAVAGIGFGIHINGEFFTGTDAWLKQYGSWASATKGLGVKIRGFVEGATNMLHEGLGIPKAIGKTMISVFLVSYAGTTLDTATRLQRYIVSEITANTPLKFLSGRYPATIVAVLSAFLLAFADPTGKGALILWPLFGTVNQLLAGLALLTITAYLIRKNLPSYISGIPMVFMIFMTGWAMINNIQKFLSTGKTYLFVIGLLIFALEIWMIIETILMLRKKSEVEIG